MTPEPSWDSSTPRAPAAPMRMESPVRTPGTASSSKRMLISPVPVPASPQADRRSVRFTRT